ncbi:hypothetical protein F5884DRAFT_747148 [Xylogone sp. PMI_703]|nr:hypothetical protein F5884DRAFT_747148 [Xylogone sp. PMI_703]
MPLFWAPWQSSRSCASLLLAACCSQNGTDLRTLRPTATTDEHAHVVPHTHCAPRLAQAWSTPTGPPLLAPARRPLRCRINIASMPPMLSGRDSPFSLLELYRYSRNHLLGLPSTDPALTPTPVVESTTICLSTRPRRVKHT